VTGYFLARMQLHACRFRLTKENTHTLNSCYDVQFSISWQYLASKLQKAQELQSGI